MINFRFHLVSIIGIFLALTLGIVMGSTVIDRAIVDGLEGRIRRVEQRAAARHSENVELRSDLAAFREYLTQALPMLIGGRLNGVGVVVIAASDVDRDAVTETVNILRAAGGVVPAVLWIEPGWSPKADGLEERLNKALGRTGVSGADLQVEAAQLLVERLTSQAPASTPGERDVLDGFRVAGLLAVTTEGGGTFGAGAYPPAESRYLVIDGTADDGIDVRGADEVYLAELSGTSAPFALVRSLVNAGAKVLLASAPRGENIDRQPIAVVAARENPDLRTRLSTVDGLRMLENRAAAVLALEDLGIGVIGHYGRDWGAKRRVPE